MTAPATANDQAAPTFVPGLIGFLRVEIEAIEPFIIANPDESLRVDRPVVCDVHGRPVVPATGLVGSLRSHLSDQAGDHLGSEPGEELKPSNLRVLGTELAFGPDSHAPVCERDQTAIDRRRGAAKSKTLHTSERVTTGATVTMWCEYDGPVPTELTDAIASWQPVLGGSVGTGHGRARVKSIATAELDLGEEADLATYLAGVTTELTSAVGGGFWTAKSLARSEQAQPLIRCNAKIVDGLFIGGMTPDPNEGESQDDNASGTAVGAAKNRLPMYRYENTPMIEGSSIRGVLRSTVAYIVSSLLRASGYVADPVQPGQGTSEHPDLVEDAIVGGDRVAAELFGYTDRRGWISIASSPITGVDDRDDGPSSEWRMHVGIDRFTGGASDSLLFSNEVLTAGRFDITIRALTDQMPDWVEPLLLLALRDIDDGYVGLGSQTARGLGTVKLSPTVPEIDFGGLAGLTSEQVEQLVEVARSEYRTGRRSSEKARKQASSQRDQNEQRADTDQEKVQAEGSPNARSYVVAATLHEVGELSWEELRARCQEHGMVCMWTDLLGLHIGPLPDKAHAPGSHVWGWSDSRWLRARIDGSRCFVAELTPGDDDKGLGVGVTRGISWLGNSEQLPRNATDPDRGSLHTSGAADTPHWLLTTRSSQPITFLQFGGNAPPANARSEWKAADK